MFEDTNNIVGLVSNSLIGATGSGDWIILGILFLAIIGFALLMGRARAGLVIMVGVASIFVFSIIEPAFAFMFWVALIISLLVLVMGLRRWLTSQ